MKRQRRRLRRHVDAMRMAAAHHTCAAVWSQLVGIYTRAMESRAVSMAFVSPLLFEARAKASEHAALAAAHTARAMVPARWWEVVLATFGIGVENTP